MTVMRQGRSEVSSHLRCAFASSRLMARAATQLSRQSAGIFAAQLESNADQASVRASSFQPGTCDHCTASNFGTGCTAVGGVTLGGVGVTEHAASATSTTTAAARISLSIERS
jgi:hypothetical protein